MSDEQLDQLMERVTAGDHDAQEIIDDWIAQALGALCTPPAAGSDASWLDNPECFCRKAVRS